VSGFDYDRIAVNAAKLIEKFGQPVVLVRTVNATTDPVTGDTFNYGQTSNQTTTGILLNYDADDIDGTRIQANDKKLVIDGSVQPLKTDLPEIAGVKLGTIVNIETKKPAASVIVHFLQVRA